MTPTTEKQPNKTKKPDDVLVVRQRSECFPDLHGRTCDKNGALDYTDSRQWSRENATYTLRWPPPGGKLYEFHGCDRWCRVPRTLGEYLKTVPLHDQHPHGTERFVPRFEVLTSEQHARRWAAEKAKFDTRARAEAERLIEEVLARKTQKVDELVVRDVIEE